MSTPKSSTSPAGSSIEALTQYESLNDKLAAFRERLESQRPDIARAYDRLVERLSVIDDGQVGPALGDRFPDFVLPDESGTLVSLQSLLARGPLIVSFNRGHWCPYCRIDLRALAVAWPDIDRVGGQIVSIMPDTASAPREALPDDALPFPILSDVDLGYALSLGLVYWVGADVAALYDQLGIALERYQGNESHFLPLAAKFVLDRKGIVRSRHIDIEFRQRIETAEIVRAITEIA